jgi:hypothetical protein
MGTSMRSGIGAWASDVREAMEDDWRSGLLLGGYYGYVGMNLTLTSRYPLGTSPLETDWDVLVVLDACRVDALRSFVRDFRFLEDVPSAWSVGSTSAEWMAHTFDRRFEAELDRTAMVTANLHTDTVLRNRDMPPQYVAAPFAWPRWDPVEPGEFDLLDEVWRYGWRDDLDTVPPRTVTDRAIAVGRQGDHDRLIVHYIQPHSPYLGRDGDGSLTTVHPDPIESLRAGRLSRETVWDAYLETLRIVLEEVGLLLENLDAERVVITADHGEAFGEWGFYEHPVCCPQPHVKRIPWVETSAVDRGEYVPSVVPPDEETVPELEDRLAALGYV